MDNLMNIPKEMFKLLFMLCDNKNSPVKDKIIILLVETEINQKLKKGEREIDINSNSVIIKLREMLRTKLLIDMGMDSFYVEPLLSRILVIALVLIL